MNSFTPSLELRRLVDGMIDGSLRRPEVARLEEILEASPEAMDYFLTMAGQEGLLRMAMGKELMVDGLTVDRAAGAGWQRRLLHAGAAAAVLTIGGWGIAAWNKAQEVVKPAMASTAGPGFDNPDAGRLTSTLGVVWESPELSLGSPLASGSAPLIFRSGLVEVIHASSTRVLLEGPASYQVTGVNSGKLHHGRLVADVPRGAEGFTVGCADGRIVDLGTEFALQVPEGPGPTEVGVFRGEVEVLSGHAPDEPAAPLYSGHAVRMAADSSTGMLSIPFDQDRFIRRLPGREFPWFHTGGEAPLVWNISPLIWGAGDYLAVMKWMSGPQALTLSRMELLLDGQIISTDAHEASVGQLSSTVGNLYRLSVPATAWRPGTWTLRAWPAGAAAAGASEGILLIEDGAAATAAASDFTGTWEYIHDGERYRRTFHPDGTCLLEINGHATPYFNQAHWQVEDGLLRVSFPASRLVEEHLLRDRNSLIFNNQPYRNARRISP